MIQRKQSVFLALILVIFILLIFMPVYRLTDTSAINGQLLGNMLFNPFLLLPMVGITLLALIAIFMYKNRPRQIKLCRAGLILSLLFSVNAILFPQFFVHGISNTGIQIANGAFLLPINIVLFATAAFFIKKDEDLVRAADRLR